jgi:hypothetical protein
MGDYPVLSVIPKVQAEGGSVLLPLFFLPGFLRPLQPKWLERAVQY